MQPASEIERFAFQQDLDLWELRFAPYPEAMYDFVLARLGPRDVVLDIGAGDFRLAWAAAHRVRRVYALEVQPPLVAAFLSRVGYALPRNLQVICANALDVPFPKGITVGVLFMRHCRHFARYFQKLVQAGARRLFTNARWGMGVEEIDLAGPRIPFEEAAPGWYACHCGHVGFKEPEDPTRPFSEAVQEVSFCPACREKAKELV